MIKSTRAFWIYPEKGNKYWKFRVIVTPSHRALVRFAERAYIKNPTDTGAFCQTHTMRLFKKGGPKNGEATGDLGNIVLSASEFYPEYISHECSHAAHGFCRRKRKSNFSTSSRSSSVSCNEEVFCYAQGWMTQQIISWAIKNGFKFKK